MINFGKVQPRLEIRCPACRACLICLTGSCKARSSKILISVAFGNWKCYYSLCFKESDSWSMIFDTGGSRKIAVTGLESWKVGEFFSRKERKGSQRLETRNPKLTNRQAKPFAAVAQCTAKKAPGNPNQDLGSVRNLAYLALPENRRFFI